MNKFKRIATLYLMLVISALRADLLPITPGEGVWNVVTRIGSAVDVLGLEASSACDFSITQEDIGSGGIFNITTTAAIYCLADEITFNTGAAITISGDYITLDLNGKYIDGSGSPCTAISVSGNNIVIKNGNITNIDTNGGETFGGIVSEVTTNDSLQNIIIQDINFTDFINTTTFHPYGAINFCANNILVGPPDNNTVNGLLVERCRSTNAGGMISCGSTTIRNCIFDNSGAPGAVVVAPGILDIAGNVIIQDCIVTGSNTFGSGGIAVFGAQNVSLQGCFVSQRGGASTMFDSGFSGGSIYLSGANVYCGDCVSVDNNASISEGSFDRGFLFNGLSTTVGGNQVNNILTVERCASQSNNGEGFLLDTGGTTIGIIYIAAKFIDCVSENDGHNGFSVTSQNSEQISGVVFNGCCVSNGSANGFSIEAYDDAVIDTVLFQDSIAQGCLGGFTLDSYSTTVTVQNVVFRNCIAQSNTAFDRDGFSIAAGSSLNIGTVKNVLLENCIAQKNARSGISLGALSDNVQIIDCYTFNNTGTGIAAQGTNSFVVGSASLENYTDVLGIPDPTKIISYSLPGAIFGVGKWVNVVS